MAYYSLIDRKKIIVSLFFFIIALCLALLLMNFNVHDQSYWYNSSNYADDSVTHYFGSYGVVLASVLFYFFDFTAFLLVPVCVVVGLLLCNVITLKNEWIRIFGCILLMIAGSACGAYYNVSLYNHIHSGGLIGYYTVALLSYWFDRCIVGAVIAIMVCISCIMLIQFSWIKPLYRFLRYLYESRLVACGIALINNFFCAICSVLNRFWNFFIAACFDDSYHNLHHALDFLVQESIREGYDKEEYQAIFDDHFWQHYKNCNETDTCTINKQSNDYKNSVTYDMYSETEKKSEHDFFQDDCDKKPVYCNGLQEAHKPFKLPSKKLFYDNNARAVNDEQVHTAEMRAKSLEQKLEQFGIRGTMVSIVRGPVVTLFEYAPAQDIKVSKILALEDDLALALEALSLRIIAPIPGKAVVGFEVANKYRDIVSFSDVVHSDEFTQFKGMLPLIIGRDTAGGTALLDLAQAPHLLVAGSTGSGKSVALNAMLVSLLCSRTPDEMKLILIDPKRLEFTPFADIAHLVFPIVTQVYKVPAVLQWAVATMEERYAILAQAGARNIQDYHAAHGVKAMPYLVIVIDELADLMMTVGQEIEELIARLAQMARAAGIHIILATQRPSVDVITGLIKVNFPSRIAFKVISKIDSRTILDCAGAEKLLGRGDMLFLNLQGMIQRLHGAYLRDEEIVSVVTAIKKQRVVEYQELSILSVPSDDDTADDEPLYMNIVAFVETVDHVSISLLQRKFRIGYNRSARIIDMLELHGIIMPADGGKFRKVVRSR